MALLLLLIFFDQCRSLDWKYVSSYAQELRQEAAKQSCRFYLVITYFIIELPTYHYDRPRFDLGKVQVSR